MTSIFRDSKQFRQTIETLTEIIAALPTVDDLYTAQIHDAESARGLKSTSYDRSTTPRTSRPTKPGVPDDPPSYSDPTGEAVVQGDQYLSQLRASRRQLHAEITHTLRTFESHIARLAPPESPRIPMVSDDIWCVSCLRVGKCEPRGSEKKVGGAPHCRWCHDFKNDRGVLPPVAILRARADGQRITEAMIEASLR